MSTPQSQPTDQEIARAEALGREAARGQLPVSDCPYPVEQRVLRARFINAYVRAGGRAGIDYSG